MLFGIYSTPEHLINLKEEYPYDIDSLTQLYFKPLMKRVYDDSDSSDDEPESLSTPEDSSFNTSTISERELEMQQEEADHGVISSYYEPRDLREETESEKETSGENTAIDAEEFPQDIREFADFGDLGGNATADAEEMVQPQRVVVEPIKYTNVASKVDVKELKAVIWGELQALFRSAGELGEKGVEFGAVLENVGPKLAQKKGVGEVSVAMSFICTLHLCNEKDLFLSQEDIDHLVVSAKPDV
eukprot:Phypoly_transcript_15504.p1 GENE.Phypoly_transcript_15504~~Phypoly_transcript_15504.p1  ORF type:complete len:244 (+),score=56.14 Phypoly_transcript_15504:145-876(+)